MSFIYIVLGLLVMAGVGFFTWRLEKSQGEDHEANWLALVKNLGITLICLIFVWQIVSTVSTLLVEYWWFQEVGYPQVWVTQKTYEWALRFVGFIATYAVLTLVQMLAQGFVPRIPTRPSEQQTADRRRSYYSAPDTKIYDVWPVVNRYYVWVSRLVKFLVGLLFSWLATWLQGGTMKVFNLVEWGKVDPIFGMDYSFFDAVLPWLQGALNWATGLWLACLIYAVAVYFFLKYKQSEFEDFYQDSDEATGAYWTGVISNSGLFAAGVAVIIAVSTYLSKFNMVIDGSSKYLDGAGYIDAVAKIPGLGFMAWVWLAFAVAAAVYAFLARKGWKFPAIAAGVVLVCWIVSMGIVPWVKGIQYNANPLGYERQYIQYQMDGVKFAFDLGKMQDQGELGFNSQMATADLKANDVTLAQTRVVDWTPMLLANETLNEFLPFYNFVDVDIDRYDNDEVMLAIRELNQDQIPQEGKNWVNLHFRYTHGYGHTVASVSNVDAQGEPKWLVRNIPPEGPSQFMVTHPEIYFGEATREFIFVGGTYTEFGRPEGTSLREVTYEGPAGVAIGGFGRRAALALMMDDYRLIFTGLIDADSRIIFNRTLDQRTAKLAAFLRCDEDPYPVLGGEEVVFIRDCYTVSDSLPYSQSYGGTRYMRGSVKMTVGAWSGKTDFYLVDETDPLIKTWMGIFPGLVQPLKNMPTYLRSHLRYPDDLMKAQADAYALYHVGSPEAFFNRQDLWERAKETQSVEGRAAAADPRYVMMVIPHGQTEEFVSNVFFTPIGKQNVVAGMTARCDDGVYGQLVVYQFPRDETVIGPQMVEARISQHEELSGKITLWNQQGSKIVWGQIIGLVLPNKDASVSVVYVRSLYLQSQEARIPSIKLVIISQGDRLVYANSLSGALTLLYGGTTHTTPVIPSPTGTQAELIAKAQQHFDAAQACAANGDWSCFGREMDALQEVLQTLNVKR